MLQLIKHIQVCEFVQMPKPMCKKNEVKASFENQHKLSKTTVKKLSVNKMRNTRCKEIAMKRPFKCKICKKSYTSTQSLKHHLYIHTGKRPLKCQFCDADFAWKDSLTKHEKLHKEQQKLTPCGICSKIFLNKFCLRTHQQLYHTQACETAQTQNPQKTFQKSPENRQKVMNKPDPKKDSEWLPKILNGRISKTKPFQCKICKKILNSKQELKIHLLSHNTGKRPFKCGFCDADFAWRDCLTKHEKLHNGQRNNHSCDIL